MVDCRPSLGPLVFSWSKVALAQHVHHESVESAALSDLLRLAHQTGRLRSVKRMTSDTCHHVTSHNYYLGWWRCFGDRRLELFRLGRHVLLLHEGAVRVRALQIQHARGASSRWPVVSSKINANQLCKLRHHVALLPHSTTPGGVATLTPRRRFAEPALPGCSHWSRDPAAS